MNLTAWYLPEADTAREQRNKLPKWIGQYIKDSDTNLATDVAIAHSKRFLRAMAQPFEQSTKSLWGIEEVRGYASAVGQRSQTDRYPPSLASQILDKQRGIDPETQEVEVDLETERLQAQALAEAEAAAIAEIEAEAAAIEAAEAEAFAARPTATSGNGNGYRGPANGDAEMQDVQEEEHFGMDAMDDEEFAAMDLPEPSGAFDLPMPPPEFDDDLGLPQLPADLENGLPQLPADFGLPNPPSL